MATKTKETLVVNYRIYKGESLPAIRIVIDEQLTIINQDWSCKAQINDITKKATYKDNSFYIEFTRQDLETIPVGIHTITIVTSNVDGFADITYRKLQVLESKTEVTFEKGKTEEDIIDELLKSRNTGGKTC